MLARWDSLRGRFASMFRMSSPARGTSCRPRMIDLSCERLLPGMRGFELELAMHHASWKLPSSALSPTFSALTKASCGQHFIHISLALQFCIQNLNQILWGTPRARHLMVATSHMFTWKHRGPRHRHWYLDPAVNRQHGHNWKETLNSTKCNMLWKCVRYSTPSKVANLIVPSYMNFHSQHNN